MKTTLNPLINPLMLMTAQPEAIEAGLTEPMPLPQLIPSGVGNRETIRHILLGSPGAVRQTIHLLHTLHYAETVLWSPVMRIEEALMITPAQGEAMSLLRRSL
ncbi:MAG: hypothetical protein HLUCCA11_13540 [Phormidesmis priestleyi Ana]|uniref:Uncharacterized protein n=1 Tax=Phormidesmis priestleyi Ana TaxID=1666911 RepID=A0A0P7YVR3_9CYAN|nr:MAG: hypothetical protein HLUCCA11_13540 [Phormidesmis priestleyi Ana]